MTCPRCQSEIDPAMGLCPQCGSPRMARPSENVVETDWRQQVRQTVQRRKELRQQQHAQREAVARQLTIFGELGEPDPEKDMVRQRRAEIRARVEQRLEQRHSPPRNRIRALADAGEVSIRVGQTSQLRTTSAAAAAAELDVDFGEPASRAFVPPPARPRRDVGSDTMEHFELASPGARLLAGLIDFGFLTLLLLGLAYLTTNLVSQPLRALPGPAAAALGCVAFFLAVGYFLFFWSLSGQTLGKLLTSSRVVDPLGQPLGFGRALVRVLGIGLSILPLGAGFVGLWSDMGRRAWHDRLASTKVVRV